MNDRGPEAVFNAIVNGRLEAARDAVQAALIAGVAPDWSLHEGLIAAMGETGRLFEAGDSYVPKMLAATRAMRGCLGLLRPAFVASDVRPVGRVVIGTVAGGPARHR